MELTNWDYAASVERMRPLVARWKTITIEMLDELHRAREALSRKRSRSNVASATLPSWQDYCRDIGLDRTTVHRWLSQYDHDRRELLPPPEPLRDICSLFVKDGLLYVNLESYGGEAAGTLITGAAPFDEWITTTTNIKHLEICRDEMLQIAQMLAGLHLDAYRQAEWDGMAAAISALVDELAKSRSVFTPTGPGWEWMGRYYHTMTADEWQHFGETAGRIWAAGDKLQELKRLKMEKTKARREGART